MNNPFIKRQMELRQHMISGFSGILVSSDEVQKGEDDLELEKAHKDGDMHPNGKWVWVSFANGGKGDWRTINGRTHQKHTAAQGGSGSSGSQGTSGGSNGTPKTEKPGQQASKVKVDTTTIDDAEYKRMYSQAKSVDDDSRSMGLSIINSNISKYKKDLEDTIAKRPGAKATIKQLQDKLTKFVSQKKAAEDVIAELEKKGNSGGKLSTAEQKALDNVVDKGFKISRSSWNDVSKMSLEKTPKGNWRCYYDGKDTGNTIAGSLMSEATAKKLGMLKDDATQGSKSALDKPSVTSSSSTDPKNKKVINATATAKTATTAKAKLDTTTIDQQEYKNMYKIATADTETEDHLKFRLANVDKMIKEVKDTFNGGEITTKKHLDMLQKDCTRLLSKKKAIEDGLKVIKKRNKAKATAKPAAKKVGKAEFTSENSVDIMKEVNANRENIQDYLGGNAEITNIAYRSIISATDKDGKHFKGVKITVAYKANNMYGPGKVRRPPIDIIIDSNGYLRNHSSYYPSLRAALKSEYSGPNTYRHLVPSLKDKFEVK